MYDRVLKIKKENVYRVPRQIHIMRRRLKSIIFDRDAMIEWIKCQNFNSYMLWKIKKTLYFAYEKKMTTKMKVFFCFASVFVFFWSGENLWDDVFCIRKCDIDMVFWRVRIYFFDSLTIDEYFLQKKFFFWCLVNIRIVLTRHLLYLFISHICIQ